VIWCEILGPRRISRSAEARDLKFCMRTDGCGRWPKLRIRTCHMADRSGITWPTSKFCDPVHISWTSTTIESPVRAVCAVHSMHAPLPNHFGLLFIFVTVIFWHNRQWYVAVMHCYLLPLLCRSLPIFDQLCARSLNFVHRCLSNDSDIVNFSLNTVLIMVVAIPVLAKMWCSVCIGISVM